MTLNTNKTIPFVFLSKFIDDAGLEGNGFSPANLFLMCYLGWGLALRLVLRRAPASDAVMKVQ